MKIESKATRGAQASAMALRGALVAALLTTTGLAAPAMAQSKTEKPVVFEAVAGSKVKRVILTERASQRLGIALGKVSEGDVPRRQIVGGVFVPANMMPPLPAPSAPLAIAGTFAFGAAPSAAAADLSKLPAVATPAAAAAQVAPAAGGPGMIRVMLSPQEWERLAKDQPARVFRLETRGVAGAALVARPMDTPPIEDFKRSMLMQHFVLAPGSHDLAVNERVRVELTVIEPVAGPSKIVPYSAVYYDAKGDTWVYVTPRPLAFERVAVKVNRIVGDRALLTDGPQVGTSIVTTGAAMLYGAELYGK